MFTTQKVYAPNINKTLNGRNNPYYIICLILITASFFFTIINILITFIGLHFSANYEANPLANFFIKHNLIFLLFFFSFLPDLVFIYLSYYLRQASLKEELPYYSHILLIILISIYLFLYLLFIIHDIISILKSIEVMNTYKIKYNIFIIMYNCGMI